jgi:hypothetical protein
VIQKITGQLPDHRRHVTFVRRHVTFAACRLPYAADITTRYSGGTSGIARVANGSVGK